MESADGKFYKTDVADTEQVEPVTNCHALKMQITLNKIK